MLSVVNLLDAARQNGGIPSDYRLSRVLCIAENTLFNYRHAGRVPVDEVVIKLASLAKLSPAYVLNCMAAERAKDPEVKAAFVAAAAALAGGFTPPGAGKLSGPSNGGVKAQKPADIDDSGAGGLALAVAQSIHRGKCVNPQALALAALGAVMHRREKLKQRPVLETAAA